MKKGLLFVLLLMWIVLMAAFCSTGCSTGQNHVEDNNTNITRNEKPVRKPTAIVSNNASYEIVKQTYNDRKITINYPQIKNMSDSKKQDKINEIIEYDALTYARWCYDPSVVSINIDYEIKYETEDLLSIAYSGIDSPGGTIPHPHPTYVFFTTNINIQEGSRLRLRDLIDIDNGFVEKVKKGKLIAVSPEITFKKLDFTNGRLIKAFNKSDVMGAENENGAYTYFTSDSLGISVHTAHVFGDHVAFEVEYQDIADNIKTENEVWKNFYILN